jgi:hypothetical protein
MAKRTDMGIVSEVIKADLRLPIKSKITNITRIAPSISALST